MQRSLFAAAALLLLCSAAVEASRLLEEQELSGRSLLQATLDCSRVHRCEEGGAACNALLTPSPSSPHSAALPRTDQHAPAAAAGRSDRRGCSTCRNQRIKGSKKTETVCSTCAAGWSLRKDGSNKICGAHPPE